MDHMSPTPDDEARVDARPATLKARIVTISEKRTFVGEVFGADEPDLEANIRAMANQADTIRRIDPNYLLFVGSPKEY